jgi:hypothetical protein
VVKSFPISAARRWTTSTRAECASDAGELEKARRGPSPDCGATLDLTTEGGQAGGAPPAQTPKARARDRAVSVFIDYDSLLGLGRDNEQVKGMTVYR